MKTGLLVISLLLLPTLIFADQTLTASRVSQLPTADGNDDESAWQLAEPISSYDPVAKINIEIRAVYTDDSIAILTRFQDPNENRIHKRLIWDAESGIYITGSQREDTMVLKWNMNPLPTDISIVSDRPYKADIWYWKSYRTDHAGYADDKVHNYSKYKYGSKNKRLISRKGQTFYFSRSGDDGTSAYQSLVPTELQEQVMEGYRFRLPTGSRADVRARGQWKDQTWTVEFTRKLETGHDDDVQLLPKNQYIFGVSRHEIAGRKPDPKIEQVNFGSGEITELLTLKFAK